MKMLDDYAAVKAVTVALKPLVSAVHCSCSGNMM